MRDTVVELYKMRKMSYKMTLSEIELGEWKKVTKKTAYKINS